MIIAEKNLRTEERYVSSRVTSNQQVDTVRWMCKIKYKAKNLKSNSPQKNQTTFRRWIDDPILATRDRRH